MRGVMIQGTSSDVGKSMICTAFCRILSDQGYSVAPFKSQNMSNNSYVTVLGEEIGRSQGIQAEAARTVAKVEMNPILLKPENDMKSQVVLFGKKLKAMDGMKYRDEFYGQGLAAIEKALAELEKNYSHLVIEGAGSPAEVNLNDRDLVNMKVAELADVPVILVADIERGGVFASIIGTLALVPNPERIKGILINKFRGDIDLFENGIEFLENYTGLPVLGVIPYLSKHEIGQEDSLGIRELAKIKNDAPIRIVVCKHPYLSNFTDIEPFLLEPDVSIIWADSIEDIGVPDILILPGTKSTIADLRFWKQQGLQEKLESLKGNIWIVGLCGGFQMLAETLADPSGYDGTIAEEEESGFGLIAGMRIEFAEEKWVERRTGKTVLTGRKTAVTGYEIHSARVQSSQWPLIEYPDGNEGYLHNRILGTHLHGLFDSAEFRSAFLEPIRIAKGLPIPDSVIEYDRFDRWAQHVKKHIDWQKVEQLLGES